MGFLLRDTSNLSGPEPRTFEELADFAEYFMGSDLNGDTIPDYGLCSLNGAAVAGPQALLMQLSKLQYLGSAHPGVGTGALGRQRGLPALPPDSEPGGWQYLHETAWLEGRTYGFRERGW